MDKYLTIAVGPVGPARGTMPSRVRAGWAPSGTDILGQMGQVAPKGGSFAPPKGPAGSAGGPVARLRRYLAARKGRSPQGRSRDK